MLISNSRYLDRAPCTHHRHGANCPTCRLDTDPASFVHDGERQAAADAFTVTCECGESFEWGDRISHVCVIQGPCPFDGCDFFGHPDDLELHTPGCVHALRYSMSLVVESALEATQGKACGVELTAEAYVSFLFFDVLVYDVLILKSVNPPQLFISEECRSCKAFVHAEALMTHAHLSWS